MISEAVINEICCDLIRCNQSYFNIDDDKDYMLYRLAYIDGMMDLKSRIMERLKEEKNVKPST